MAGVRIDAARRMPLLPPRLTLAADLERADQLHFGEARNRSAREIAPGATVRRGVDDHRLPDLREPGRHVSESAIDDVTLEVAIRRRRCQDLPNLVELEHDGPPGVGIELDRKSTRLN